MKVLTFVKIWFSTLQNYYTKIWTHIYNFLRKCQKPSFLWVLLQNILCIFGGGFASTQVMNMFMNLIANFGDEI